MGIKEERTREENLAVMARILKKYGYSAPFNLDDVSKVETRTLPYCIVVTFKGGSPGNKPAYIIGEPDTGEFNSAYIVECFWRQDERNAALVRQYLPESEIAAIDKIIERTNQE